MEESKGEDKFKMVYRYLGNTGMKVSLLSFGTMLVKYTDENVQNWLDCAKIAFDNGINYFDSAEMYGDGEGDKMLGRAIKEHGWRREDLVISVKMFGGPTPNRKGLSRKKIIESCKLSLKNMDLDYCDLVFAHRWETDTPLEETCKAFNWLINKGYANYWATSAWPSDLIMRAIKLCDKKGWHRPVADQCEYNCLIREHMEDDYIRLFEKYGYGTTIWSPLGGGMLTGKYNDATIPEGSRYSENPMFKAFAWDKYIGPDKVDKTKKILHGLKEIAEDLGYTQAQLALAWTLVNSDVSSCIIGASRPSQLESNLGALTLAASWTTNLEDKLNTLLDNQPEGQMNSLIFAKEARRPKIVNYKIKLGKLERRPADHTEYD